MNQSAEGQRFQGHMNGEGLKIAVVAGRFNSFITNSLMSGCMDGLLRHGVAAGDVDVAWAPGAFEIPLVARKLAETKRYDAIIAIGAVIRGATPHFDYVCAENAKGIASVGHDAGIPVIYGVVTTDTVEQAIERAGTKAGNKGWDAATAAIEMANLLKSIADA